MYSHHNNKFKKIDDKQKEIDEKIINTIEAEMSHMVKNLTEEQDKILKNAFKTIDTNQNGFLDPSEVRVFLSIKWKELISPETIESIVNLADVNHDGLISYQEFVRLQLKCLPLCKGYCYKCKKVILGIDGWTCPKCIEESTKTQKKSYSLCLKCYSKGESNLPKHEHLYKEFKRLRLSDIKHEKIEELGEMVDFYERKILKPLLHEHIKKVESGKDDEEYWNSVLKCIMQ